MCRIKNGRNMQLSRIQQERGAYQTTHPPVLVPPMRSKSSYGWTAFSPSFSRSAFTSAIKALRMSSVESPRTPPPSVGFCQSDLGGTFRRILPNDRRHNPVLSKGLPPLLRLVTCSCSMPDANESCRALIRKDGTTLQLYSQGTHQRSSASSCVAKLRWNVGHCG